MPELPELEVACEVLNRRVVGQPITRVEVLPPGGAIAVRDLAQQGLDAVLLGGQFTTIRRRGKFLVFTVESAADRFLVINPKLTGRLQLAAVGDRATPRPILFSPWRVARNCVTLAHLSPLPVYSHDTMTLRSLLPIFERLTNKVSSTA